MTNFAFNFAFGAGIVPTPPGATVAPGPNTGASINATIVAANVTYVATGVKQTVYLQPGVYYLETTIVMKSGVILKGAGDSTILVPTFTGAADTATNAVISADGTIDTGTLSTTFTAVTKKNTSTLALTAAGTIVAGTYILIEGTNVASTPQDAANESLGSSVVLSEIVQVASTYVSGVSVPTAWPVRQHHGTTAITARAVVPVIGAEVRDLQIQGSLSGVTTANGIFGRYCVDLAVVGVTFLGCSRMGVDIYGCKEVEVASLRSKGTNNGWLMLTTAIGVRVRTLRGEQGVARIHSSGVPRYVVYLRSRCTDVDIDDVHITGTCFGMYIAGGEHIHVGNLDVTDVAPTTAAYNSFVASGELQNLGYVPLGFGIGLGPLAYAEYAHDVVIDRIRCEDLRAPNEAIWNSVSPYLARAVYLHDCLEGQVGQISVINRGDSPSNTLVSGVTISDWTGKIDSIFVCGHTFGLCTDNSANQVTIDTYRYKGNAGNTPNGTIPFYLNHTSPANQSFRFREVTIDNANSLFRCGGSFAGDSRFRIDLITVDGSDEWTDVIIGHIGADVATGDVMEIDPAATDNTRQDVIVNAAAAGFERRMAAIVSGDDIAGSSFVLICPLPARAASVKATAALCTRGGLVRATGTGTTTVQEDAAAAHPLGIFRDYKANGSAGKVRIGPVNS